MKLKALKIKFNFSDSLQHLKRQFFNELEVIRNTATTRVLKRRTTKQEGT